MAGNGQFDDSQSETLEQLEAIREAARRASPGTLTIVYEERDGTFGDQ